ncbi:MAG: Stf0 family sulfotransferase [Gammaproteobacteria bacterium]|nr:Stf0 family sulfotransferase [Gammaproteobacteria bacterium]
MVHRKQYKINTTEFDCLEVSGPQIQYIICSMPRCGSTYLSRCLNATGLMGVAHEYLTKVHFDAFQTRFGTQSVQDTLERIRRVRTTPNGVFGLKVHYHVFQNKAPHLDIVNTLGDASLIVLERKDVLGQAVSWAMSRQSAFWGGGNHPKNEVLKYDEELIATCLNRILCGIAGWRRYASFAKNKNKDLYVRYLTYEDFIGREVEIVHELAQGMSINWSPEVESKLQAVIYHDNYTPSPLKQEWVERYSASCDFDELMKWNLPANIIPGRDWIRSLKSSLFRNLKLV